jgi:hypothetical protein
MISGIITCRLMEFGGEVESLMEAENGFGMV